MQLINALATLAALLPLATAKPTPLPHSHLHRDIADFASDLETRGDTPRCSKRGAHIVISSGHGAPNVNGYGLLKSTALAVRTAIPYSNNMSTVYDKQNDNWPVGVATGVGNLTEHIEWYTAGCPNTPIILLGYSEGAIVTLNTLCGRSVAAGTSQGIDEKYNANIAATILYGDETRLAGQPYNAGTCTTGSGVLQRLNPAGCRSFAANFISYCDVNDPQCCKGQGDAPDQNVHYIYPSEYDGDVAQFAVDKFLAWKAARKGAAPAMKVASAPAPLGGETVQGASPTNAAFKSWLEMAKEKVSSWLSANGFAARR